MNAELSVSEQKREAIIRAAVTEFEANGFQATSMDRIAETAQVSKRTVYNHFPSKEALFKAITSELWEQAIQVTDLPYDSNRTLEEQLFQIGEREIDLLTSQCFMSLTRVTLAEYSRSPEIAREAFDSFKKEDKGLIRWIRQASNEGRLTATDPRMAADQFLALIQAFAFWPQMFGGQPPPSKQAKRKIINSAVEMFLHNYAK